MGGGLIFCKYWEEEKEFTQFLKLRGLGGQWTKVWAKLPETTKSEHSSHKKDYAGVSWRREREVVKYTKSYNDAMLLFLKKSATPSLGV